MHDETIGGDAYQIVEVIEGEWVAFAGGELEGHRPKVACPSCRLRRPGSNAPLCFECYRADIARRRAADPGGRAEEGRKEATEAASAAHWRELLPFEPVNHPRLAILKRERAAARAGDARGRFHERRRRAQMAARAALRGLAEQANRRAIAVATHPLVAPQAGQSASQAALHEDLRLPESWLRFVVSA